MDLKNLKNAERNQLWINAFGHKGFIPTKVVLFVAVIL